MGVPGAFLQSLEASRDEGLRKDVDASVSHVSAGKVSSAGVESPGNISIDKNGVVGLKGDGATNMVEIYHAPALRITYSGASHGGDLHRRQSYQ